MSLSKNKAQNTSDNSTTVTTTNQQVGASEGSVAVGANANVNIQSIDKDVIESVTNAQTQQQRKAFETVETLGTEVTSLSRDLSEGAFDLASDTSDKSFDFASQALQANVKTNEDTRRSLESANQILNNSFQRSLEKVQRAQGVDDSTLVSEGQRNQTLLLGALAVGGLILLGRKGSN